MTDLSKTFTLAEVEGLLAAERERCAKVADRWAARAPGAYGWTVEQAAAAIRSLPPKPIGGE